MDAESQEKKTVNGEGSNGLAILKERYAKGDLSREQYMKMREDIIGGD